MYHIKIHILISKSVKIYTIEIKGNFWALGQSGAWTIGRGQSGARKTIGRKRTIGRETEILKELPKNYHNLPK